VGLQCGHDASVVEKLDWSSSGVLLNEQLQCGHDGLVVEESEKGKSARTLAVKGLGSKMPQRLLLI
jgi:hypothetical protein